jgi:hypothetical protein
MRSTLSLCLLLLAQHGCTVEKSDDSSDDFDADSRSRISIEEAIALVNRDDMTIKMLQRSLATTPILVRSGRLHWRLCDGSLWTDFEIVNGVTIVTTYEVGRSLGAQDSNQYEQGR